MLLLLACAHVIKVDVPSPPTPPATAAPSAAEVPRLCWVEMATGTIGKGVAAAHGSVAQDVESTMSGLVVVHPGGTWLFDAGAASTLDAHMAELRGLPRFATRQAAAGFTIRGTMADALRAQGFDPAALTGIAISHAHFDHLGGIVDLPGIPVYAPQAELDYAQAVLDGEGFGVLPAEGRAFLPRARPVTFEPAPFLYWAQSKDLYGDGAVRLLPTPGHTPGSMAVYIQAPGGRRVLFVGDTVWVREGYEALEPKGGIAAMFDDDHAQNDVAIAQLHALHAADPSLHILPAHDRRAWRELFGAPGCLSAG